MEKDTKYLSANQVYTFTKCKNIDELSALLEVESETIQNCILAPQYQQFSIPKKKGGVRIILSPEPILKDLQSKIAKYLNLLYNVNIPSTVHGFIQSNPYLIRNIKTNAIPHLKKNYLLNLDLCDFFPSITALMVKESLMKFPGIKLNEEVASIISLLASYNWKLPAGSPLSPILSNIVFYRTDLMLEVLAIKYKLNYSRYADDLSFSADTKITENILSELEAIISLDQFSFNKKKERLQTKYGAQWVTGIKVNTSPNISRKKIRLLRSILHSWKLNGLEAAKIKYFENFPVIEQKKEKDFISIIAGKIAYVKYVRKSISPNDSVIQKLEEKFKALVEDINIKDLC